MGEKTAIFIRKLEGFNGDARLYSVSPPMVGGYVWDDEPDAETPPMRDFVIVSAAVVPYSEPETYIFGANADGAIESWMELEGSFRGALDHARALENAGYVIELRRANADESLKLLSSTMLDVQPEEESDG